MIPSDKNDAGRCPELDKDHPHGVTEGTLVVVGDADTQRDGCLLASLVDESGWDDVLDPSPGVAARETHQELETVRGQGDCCGWDESQEGEESFPGPVGISPALREEQGLQVVAEGDGDDGEVCAEREDREEREEDVKREEKPGVGWRWLGGSYFRNLAGITLLYWLTWKLRV